MQSPESHSSIIKSWCVQPAHTLRPVSLQIVSVRFTVGCMSIQHPSHSRKICPKCCYLSWIVHDREVLCTNRMSVFEVPNSETEGLPLVYLFALWHVPFIHYKSKQSQQNPKQQSRPSSLRRICLEPRCAPSGSSEQCQRLHVSSGHGALLWQRQTIEDVAAQSPCVFSTVRQETCCPGQDSDARGSGGEKDLAWKTYQMLWHCGQVSVSSACMLQGGIVFILYIYLFI